MSFVLAGFRQGGSNFAIRHARPPRKKIPVIPGPPQAEPGIQTASPQHRSLDSGFAQARAPE
jgi:hypothetical protein